MLVGEWEWAWTLQSDFNSTIADYSPVTTGETYRLVFKKRNKAELWVNGERYDTDRIEILSFEEANQNLDQSFEFRIKFEGEVEEELILSGYFSESGGSDVLFLESYPFENGDLNADLSVLYNRFERVE